MVSSRQLPGGWAEQATPAQVASQLLPVGVVHLDPEPAVFDAMLNGWAAQMASRA